MTLDKTLTLSILYDANSGGAKPLLTGVDASNLTCSGRYIANLNAKQPVHPTIPSVGAGIAIPCVWKADATVGAVVVHTTLGDEVAELKRSLPVVGTMSVDLVLPVQLVEREGDQCGPWGGASTDMDGKQTDSWHDGRCTHASNDGKQCKGDYGVNISPTFGGALSALSFECQDLRAKDKNGLGWCEWNALGDHVQYSPIPGGGIRASFWVGSKPVQIRLCAHEKKLKESETHAAVTDMQNLALYRGMTFVVRVLETSHGAVLNITWAATGPTALRVGTSSTEIGVVGQPVDVGEILNWNYRINTVPHP